MKNKPDIADRLARHALALTRAGMIAADREFMDIVEPGWDDAPAFEEELRRTRLVLERASAALEVHFGDNGRVKFKAQPSGAVVWLTVGGDDATMTRRIEKGLKHLAQKVEAAGEGEGESERRRASARGEADRIIAEVLPAHVTARREWDGRVYLQSADDSRVRVYTWADGENVRANVKAALARLDGKISAS
jgi:hypothetical protein